MRKQQGLIWKQAGLISTLVSRIDKLESQVAELKGGEAERKELVRVAYAAAEREVNRRWYKRLLTGLKFGGNQR